LKTTITKEKKNTAEKNLKNVRNDFSKNKMRWQIPDDFYSSEILKENALKSQGTYLKKNNSPGIGADLLNRFQSQINADIKKK
jgi:hypothetical protein